MLEYYCKKTVIPMNSIALPETELSEFYPRKKDLLFYELGICGEDEIFVRIFPEIGFKSSALTYRGMAVEPNSPDFLPILYAAPSWGSYIPYPTPNRVRDGRFTFGGETVRMEKHGRIREAHGLAYDSVWHYDEPVVAGGEIHLRGWLDIVPGDENYPAFPFKSRLTAEYALCRDSLRFSYCVENLDTRPMPYGLCKHPFFLIPQDGERIEIQVAADDTYETTPDLLPTGRFLPVAGDAARDLRSFRDVRELKLDTVYTHLHGDSAFVRYPQRGYQLRIRMSEEFRNVVVFTTNSYELPNDIANMFCIESQTCCTDAINMHEKGFPESSLLILRPGECKRGEILYRFEEITE